LKEKTVKAQTQCKAQATGTENNNRQ